MTLFAAVPCWLDKAGAGRARHRDWNGVEREFAAGDVAELWRLELFRTRDAHIGELARAGVRDASAHFDRLLALGLVADAATLLQPAAAPLAAHQPASPLLVVRSYERPAGLARLLASILRDGEHHGIAHEVAVVDDTLDAAKGDHTREIVAAFARQRGAPTWLLGPAERERALATLDASVPEARALHDLLDPAEPSAVTGSRTWNWAVLLAAGRALSILDDDTSFPLRRFAADDARLELADSSEAVVRFFDDGSWVDGDPARREPYAELAEWLGRDCSELKSREGWRDDALPFRSPAELAHLRGGSRVVGVVPGLYGGIAFNSSVYLLNSNAPSQASLFRAPYRHERLEADAVWHGYPQPRLTRHAVYTPLLLDDRELLPFAGTWGRVDDTYFLALLKALAPDAAFAHVPWMLGHIDMAPRHRLRRAVEPLLLDRNAALAGTFLRAGEAAPAGTRAARLANVGAQCAAIGNAGGKRIRQHVAEFRTAMIDRVVAQLEHGLATYRDGPPEWRATVDHALATNRAFRAAPAPDATEIDLVRRAYLQAARACDAWPALWRAAATSGGLARELAVALD